MFRIIRDKLPDLSQNKKYMVLASSMERDSNFMNPFKNRDLISNYSSKPQIKTFRITFNQDNQCLVDIDFIDNKVSERFLNYCNDKVKSLLKERNEPLIGTKNTISYSISIIDSLEKNKQLLDNVFSALNKTDVLDENVLNHLIRQYPYLDCFKDIKDFNENLKKEIKEIIDTLNKANVRGNVIGLFKNPDNTIPLPPEVAAIIADFLPEEKNLALICKGAAQLGRDEVDTEVDKFLTKGLSI